MLGSHCLQEWGGTGKIMNTYEQYSLGVWRPLALTLRVSLNLPTAVHGCSMYCLLPLPFPYKPDKRGQNLDADFLPVTFTDTLFGVLMLLYHDVCSNKESIWLCHPSRKAIFTTVLGGKNLCYGEMEISTEGCGDPKSLGVRINDKYMKV